MLVMVMPLSVFKHIKYHSECTFLSYAQACMHVHAHTHTHTQSYIYIYIYICISQKAQNKLQCKDLTCEPPPSTSLHLTSYLDQTSKTPRTCYYSSDISFYVLLNILLLHSIQALIVNHSHCHSLQIS